MAEQERIEVPSFMANVGSTMDSRTKKQHILLYGKEGTGKTLFGASCPGVIWYAFEEGTKTLQSRGINIEPKYSFPISAVRNKEIRPYRDIMWSLDIIKNKKGDFAKGGKYGDRQTIFFDGWTALSKLLLFEVMVIDNEKNPSMDKADWDDYGLLGRRMDSIAAFIEELDMFFVSTAHVGNYEVAGTSGLTPMPDAIGSFRNRLPYLFDEFYYMRKSDAGGKVSYFMHTNVWRGHPAKCRTEGVPEMIEWNGYPSYEQLYGDWKQYV